MAITPTTDNDNNNNNKPFKQERACKNCGYKDIWQGNTISSWFEISHITREPIVSMKCENCGGDMQIHHQSSHRRIYKCWSCGVMDADKVFYENGTKPFSEMDAMTRYYHDPAHYEEKENK